MDNTREKERQAKAVKLRLAENGDDIADFGRTAIFAGGQTCFEVDCATCTGPRFNRREKCRLVGPEQNSTSSLHQC